MYFKDSRKAAQGVQPLVRNEVTHDSPDFNRPGWLPRRAHIQGLPLYRSAPFVPKGFFAVIFYWCASFRLFVCGILQWEGNTPISLHRTRRSNEISI